jgi:hypothetical protein
MSLAVIALIAAYPAAAAATAIATPIPKVTAAFVAKAVVIPISLAAFSIASLPIFLIIPNP